MTSNFDTANIHILYSLYIATLPGAVCKANKI